MQKNATSCYAGSLCVREKAVRAHLSPLIPRHSPRSVSLRLGPFLALYNSHVKNSRLRLGIYGQEIRRWWDWWGWRSWAWLGPSSPASARPARRSGGVPSRMIFGRPCRSSMRFCSASNAAWRFDRSKCRKLYHAVSWGSSRPCRAGTRVAGTGWLGWLPCDWTKLVPKGAMDRVPADRCINVPFDPKAKAELKLSVEAAGRKELNRFARLKAGGGDVAAEDAAIDPEDERRAVSAFHVNCCDNSNNGLKTENLKAIWRSYHHRAGFAQNPSSQR